MSKQTVPMATPMLMPTYNRFPLTLVKGKGSWVWDETGGKYLDFTAGIATCNLGHAPDQVKAKLELQLDQLWHCSNLYHIPPQEELAEMLVKNSFGDQVFFCNSGAEANEAAIKLARRYAQVVKGTNACEIVTFSQSFHGRTLATLAATGQEKIQQGFAPLAEGFRYLPYNDKDALELLVTDKTCAVLLELVQGEGGVIPADYDWVQQLAAICKQNGILLMIDEIQTGIGRTGTLFAYEQYGLEPDVISLAKGLGSGIPIGAIIANQKAAQAFSPGSHGSTFGGNPFSTTAGLATITHIIEQGIVKQAAELGAYLEEKLHGLKQQFPEIKEIRGKGLLQGIVVEGNAMDYVTKARERQQLLLLVAGPDVIRVLPPLTTSEAEIDQFIAAMEKVFAS
ncbi:aspartate aminotransferase family protein [Virgibacillus senegalensis]|uniref:aspartate aminotransferase family protein n=1 Tax=Virgibacillus senegalensis TaxID=1499679 RepID=UPI00069ED4D6|nr:aspartate aminotransferase family protein [Virgibacillus senegalensis]